MFHPWSEKTNMVRCSVEFAENFRDDRQEKGAALIRFLHKWRE
jgi:hypothetical protein